MSEHLEFTGNGSSSSGVLEVNSNGNGELFDTGRSRLGQRPALSWHRSVPRAIRKFNPGEADADVWKAWRKYLRGRKLEQRRGLAAASELLAVEQGANSLRELDAKLPPVAEFLSRPVAASFREQAARETLAFAYALPKLAQSVPAQQWWPLVERLWYIAAEAMSDAELLPSHPLVHALLAGELPFLLSIVLPELHDVRELGTAAGEPITASLNTVVDSAGLPKCEWLPLFPAIVASWTRCQLFCGKWRVKKTTQHEHFIRFREAVGSLVRLTRRDGTLTLSSMCGDQQAQSHLPWLATAVTVAGGEVPAMAAASLGLKPNRGGKSTRRNSSDAKLPEPALHTETSLSALLRCGWKPSIPRLFVTYGQRHVRLELATGRDVLFSGNWELELTVGGQRAELTRDWEQVCWVSDCDVDYLEIEAPLTEHIKVQRQLLLAREERVLLLADAILSTGDAANTPREINYTSRLPLTSAASVQPAEETREITLLGNKPRAMIFPLALSEWRSEMRSGSFDQHDNRLTLSQQTTGRSLFAPLWFDLTPRRFRDSFTWRPLTVAEQRQNQPRDIAFGTRVQFGNRHWLVYRSLRQPSNRTMLGQNFSSEFVCGRFPKSGMLRTLLEVE